MNRVIVTLIASTFMLLTACDKSDRDVGIKKEDKTWNQSDVISALNLQGAESGGHVFTIDGDIECKVSAIMTSRSAVEMYVNAGDAIASNSSKTAGVKITATETKSCLEAAEAMLADLE